MILCDFDDLNVEDFHLKFFDSVIQGNIELITEILEHPTLSKKFDVTYRNHYCIIASIMNSQQVNDCHMEFLRLFTESPLLKKHADPKKCTYEDIFYGALGNAIIFSDIEAIRFIGKFFTGEIPNVQKLIFSSIFNHREDGFFYLVEERKVIIEKPEFLYKSLSKFNNPSKAILSYLDNLSKSNASYKENLDEFIDSGLGDVVEESFKDMLDREISSSNTKAGARIKKSKGKNPTESSGLEVLSKEPLSNSNSIKSPVKNQTILLNVTGLKPVHSENIWGSRFRQKI